MLLHTILKRIVLHVTKLPKLTFDFGFGLLFLYAAHGVNAVRIFLHLLAMYSIGHIFKNNRKLATFYPGLMVSELSSSMTDLGIIHSLTLLAAFHS